MNAFQRTSQITIPSSEPVRKMSAEMIDMTRRRRSFQYKAFNKQAFFNCLIAGMYEMETRRDLDLEDVESRGLLAVVIDRGADELNKMIAADDAPILPRGARATIAGLDDDEDVDAPAPPPPPKARHRKPPGLIIPKGLVASHHFRRDDRAQEKAEAAGRRPIP